MKVTESDPVFLKSLGDQF